MKPSLLAANPSVNRVLRIFLGLVFVWAAISKLGNPAQFLGSVYAYELSLPRALLQLVAIALPWFELICGLLLLANLWELTALVCATGLLLIFFLATLQALIRGLHISCGCFNLALLGISNSSPLTKLIDS